MARTLRGQSKSGTVKSIQHISGTVNSNTTTNITVTAVVIANSVIYGSPVNANWAGYTSNVDRSWNCSSGPSAHLSSTTNVAVAVPDISMPDTNLGDNSGTWYGCLVEYEG